MGFDQARRAVVQSTTPKKKPTVFMVAEKPMLAKAIALAHHQSNWGIERRRASNKACFVYEYDGEFLGQKVRFKVTSTCGHVMHLNFHSKYNNWNKTDPLQLFDAETLKNEADPKLKMPAFLESEAAGCEYLILWLDCDKEGENICFEVIDAVKEKMNLRGGDEAIFRARFSAVSKKDITTAMNTLGKPNESESLAVDARLEEDLRVGCAITRCQTKQLHTKYGNLNSDYISYGPCQTPALAFCVARHDDIKNFKPEPYWELKIVLDGGIELNQKLDRKWLGYTGSDEKFERFVSDFANKIMKCREAKVLEIVEEKKELKKPLALNAFEYMRVASSIFGLSPERAMEIAQWLYTNSYSTYPRTETTVYPESFDLQAMLECLIEQVDRVRGGWYQNALWIDDATKLHRGGIDFPLEGDIVTDHPPITPVIDLPEESDNVGDYHRTPFRSKPQEKFWKNGDAGKLVDFISRHFLATLSKNCKYNLITATFLIGGKEFIIKGKKVTEPGFTKFLPWQAIEDDEYVSALEELEKGEVMAIAFLTELSEEMETVAPSNLTESDLIKLMQDHRIGTDGSIAGHIEKIRERNYVHVTESGRELVPTPLGIALVHMYKELDERLEDLVKPEMRAEMEDELNTIKDRASYREVVDGVLSKYRIKYDILDEAIKAGRADKFFQEFKPVSECGVSFYPCGKCKEKMKLITTRPMRLHCAKCQRTYDVFKDAKSKKGLRKDDRNCKKCEAPIIFFDCFDKGTSQWKFHQGCMFCDEIVSEFVPEKTIRLHKRKPDVGAQSDKPQMHFRGGRGKFGRGRGRGRGDGGSGSSSSDGGYFGGGHENGYISGGGRGRGNRADFGRGGFRGGFRVNRLGFGFKNGIGDNGANLGGGDNVGVAGRGRGFELDRFEFRGGPRGGGGLGGYGRGRNIGGFGDE